MLRQQGRVFSEDLETDHEKVLVNETLVREMGWAAPLGQLIKLDNDGREVTYQVCGVVKDFYYNSLWQQIRPAMLRLAGEDEYRYLVVKFRSADLAKITSFLSGEWQQLFPHLPYDGLLVDEIQAEARMVNDSIRRVFRYIAIIAVIIAGMRLYALVSLNIARRAREIGIRKVLGATLLHIGRLISREFILLLLIADLLVSALAYWGVTAMLESIWAYHVEFGLYPFAAGAVLMSLAALLTVGFQVYRVASSNPVEAIREE